MFYREEHCDLFACPEEYALAQCISADFVMGKGIVVQFNRRFGLKKLMKAQYPDYLANWVEAGMRYDCLHTGRVLNLITKARWNMKPTYDELRGALAKMREIALEQGIGRIAMPKIGCGLDGLKWPDVSAVIQEVFADTDIEILVCLWP